MRKDLIQSIFSLQEIFPNEPLVIKNWPAGWGGVRFNGKAIQQDFSFSFSRNNQIVTNPKTWEVDEPRFGNSRQVNRYEEPFTAIAIASSNLDWLGSGWDLDGVTPLCCIYNRAAQSIQWRRGNDFTLVRNQSLGSPVDLLGGAVPTHRYAPTAGIVHEGLHVVVCERVVISSGQVDSIAFFYTQDYGETWTEVPPLVADTVPGIVPNANTLGISRGARWSFSNAFPVDGPHDATKAFFGWGDYLEKSGNPKGGQIGLFRATRPSIGDTWTVEQNRVLFDIWEASDNGGFHSHGASVHAQSGVVYAYFGDVGYRNEIIGLWLDDMENYTTATITTQRNAHGGFSGSNTVYHYAMQPASFAPGPRKNLAIGTCDENPERFVLITPTDSSSPVSLTPIEDSTPNSTSGAGYLQRTSLWIHRVRGRGWVAREIGAGSITGNDNRRWFSPDGVSFGKVPNKYASNPHIYGNYILGELNNTGIIGTPIPLPKVYRPLCINPGGTNLSTTVLDQETAPTAGVTVNQVYIDGSGVFRYTTGDAALDPQPVSLPPINANCPIIEITTPDNQRNAGGRWIQAVGQTTNWANRHCLNGWVYPLEHNGTILTFQMGATGGAGNLTTERGRECNGTYVWQKVWQFSKPTNNPNNRAKLNVRQLQNGANRWLFALESLISGTMTPYALAPGQTGNNELATLSGFTLEEDWSAYLNFIVPDHSSWDAWGVNLHGDIIIGSLVGDANNHIQVVYDQTNLEFEVRITIGGVLADTLIATGVYLSKGDPVHLVISANASATEMTVSFPQNGSAGVMSHDTSASVLATRPTQIMLGSNPAQTIVVASEWVSTGVNQDTYLDQNERISLISQLPI